MGGYRSRTQQRFGEGRRPLVAGQQVDLPQAGLHGGAGAGAKPALTQRLVLRRRRSLSCAGEGADAVGSDVLQQRALALDDLRVARGPCCGLHAA